MAISRRSKVSDLLLLMGFILPLSLCVAELVTPALADFLDHCPKGIDFTENISIHLQNCLILSVLCFHSLKNLTLRTDCNCKWANGKREADCTRAGFTAVPTHLDHEIQILRMTHNYVRVLGNEVFMTAGLVNLQRIFMNHCHVQVSLFFDRGYHFDSVLEYSTCFPVLLRRILIVTQTVTYCAVSN